MRRQAEVTRAREKEKEQIIRSSSASSVGGGGLDQQLVNCLLMPSSSSASARNLAEFLAGGGKGFPLFSPVSAYGGNWNQQQQIMMAMNRPGLLMDVGEVRRSSSHSSGSPHAGIGGGGGGSLHSDAKRNPNKMESGPIPTQLSPSVTCTKYGSASAGFPIKQFDLFRCPLLLIRSSSHSSRPAIRYPPVIRGEE